MVVASVVKIGLVSLVSDFVLVHVYCQPVVFQHDAFPSYLLLFYLLAAVATVLGEQARLIEM